MYQSRLFLTNGVVSMEFDALNGEVLAFVRESTADNARKNHILPKTDMLDGVLVAGEEKRHLSIPRYAEIRLDPALTPKITVEQGEGEGKASVFYPYLVADGEKVAVSAEVTVRLLPGDCRTLWDLKLKNGSGFEVRDLSFPEIGGLWLGEEWTDDVLAIPRVSGELVTDPTAALSTPAPQITWKWQEYLHKYNWYRSGVKDDRGVYFLRVPYTGGGSMLWADLFDRGEGTGIYLSVRDPAMRFSAVRAFTLGSRFPGAGLGVEHHPCLKEGEWNAPQGILAFHEGDWHWAAREYRAMRDTYARPVLSAPSRPAWFEKSPGMAAHYDFRYQGGGVVHRFADLPALWERAKDWRLDHLFLSGWNEDGFDYGFPHYKPDSGLGGPEGLKAALKEVHEKGGRVSFYVNSRLCNVAFADQAARIEKSAVMREDGSLHIENYGAGDVRFATLCMNEDEWRAEFAAAIRYLLQEIGADGIYLDQLAMSAGMLCRHPGHSHEPQAWNQGYEKLLDQIRRENPGKAIFYEGCCDIFGRGVSGQLISTLRSVRRVSPEIYRYTFPDEVLLDMENPRRHSGMRPEHVARRSTFYLYRGFVCGLYFWVYDLEGDNTFERDPEQLCRLRAAARLRRSWLETFGYGVFRDQEGLENVSETDLVKRYDLADGVLVACAREGGLSGSVSLRLDGKAAPSSVTVYTAVSPDGAPVPASAAQGLVTLPLPPEELCFFVIK